MTLEGDPDSWENQDSIVHLKFKLVAWSGHSVILLFRWDTVCELAG